MGASRWIALGSVGLLAASCNLIFPFEPGSRDRDTGNGDVAELPVDGRSLEGTFGDGPIGDDAATETPPITCGAPAPVNDMTDEAGIPLNLVGPALRPDHQHLVARLKDQNQSYIAVRAADGTHFGNWAPYAPLHGYRDPSFFLRGLFPTERVMAIQEPPAAPELQSCAVQATQLVCDSSLPFDLPSLTVLGSADVKAIFVPILSQGEELIFSAQTGGSPNANLYWGKVPTNDTVIGTSLIPSLNSAADDSDPAISPDGGLVVFSSTRALSMGKHDLWVALRNPFDTSSFFPPIPMFLVHPSLNTAGDEGGADLAVVEGATGDVLELYFHSDRSGSWQIYRAACELP